MGDSANGPVKAVKIEGVGLHGGTMHSTAKHLRNSKTVEEVKRPVGDSINEAFH